MNAECVLVCGRFEDSNAEDFMTTSSKRVDREFKIRNVLDAPPWNLWWEWVCEEPDDPNANLSKPSFFVELSVFVQVNALCRQSVLDAVYLRLLLWTRRLARRFNRISSSHSRKIRQHIFQLETWHPLKKKLVKSIPPS